MRDGGTVSIFLGAYHEPASFELQGLELTGSTTAGDGAAIALDASADTTLSIQDALLSGGVATDSGIEARISLSELEILDNVGGDAALTLDGAITCEPGEACVCEQARWAIQPSTCALCHKGGRSRGQDRLPTASLRSPNMA